MQDLTQVIEEIRSAISPGLRPEAIANFEQWLNSMQAGSSEERRFLCCLATELRHGIVNADSYVDLFNLLKFEHTVTTEDIEAYLADNHNKHFFSNVACKERNEYVRVLALSTFMNYFLNRSDFNDVLNPNDLPTLINEMQKGFYKNVCMPNDGPPFRGIAWILPKSSYLEIADEAERGNTNLAEELVRKLAIRANLDYPDYIRINYPHDFDEETYQPCTINAKLDDECWFLSYKKDDNFGRTRPLDSDQKDQRQRERVHKPLGDKYKYSIEYIGKITRSQSYNGDIADDAYNRFLE